MTRKNLLFLTVGLLAVGVLIYFLYPGIRSTDGKCKLCAEEIHKGMRYTVTLSDGGKIKTCCPTCGLFHRPTISNATEIIKTVRQVI